MKSCFFVLVCLTLLSSLRAEFPSAVLDLVREMKDTGVAVRGGVSKTTGFFLVGIGTARYRAEDPGVSREIAEANAKKQLAAALGQSIKAKDVTILQMKVENDKAEASAFVSSLTESSVDQLLRGVQVLESGKNSKGEMYVVVYLATQSTDMTAALSQSMLKLGDQGVVTAVGIDVRRDVAERNALRSAVEQVAGTLVVGKVSVNEKEEMHKRLATTSGALIEEYRVIKEVRTEVDFRVEILARVNKRKLYENYRSYFKCLDNPVFCIRATDPSLVRHFTQFFVDKGFLLSDDPGKAHYVIELEGRFRDRPTPGNPESQGTMLDLSIAVKSTDGQKVLLMMNACQAKDSAVLGVEQRREETARRIFGKLEARLHQAIHDMIVRLLDDVDVEPGKSLQSGTSF